MRCTRRAVATRPTCTYARSFRPSRASTDASNACPASALAAGELDAIVSAIAAGAGIRSIAPRSFRRRGRTPMRGCFAHTSFAPRARRRSRSGCFATVCRSWNRWTCRQRFPRSRAATMGSYSLRGRRGAESRRRWRRWFRGSTKRRRGASSRSRIRLNIGTRVRACVISQRQVGVDTPSLCARFARRAAFRSGRHRRSARCAIADSIAGALTAAETGHLVLASLHTSDAGKTVDRIVDAFASGSREQIRTQLARVLVGVVCQQLVRRVGGGRLAVFEVLVATDAVRALIRENKVHQLKNAIATGRQFGMQTLESHVAALLAAGRSSRRSRIRRRRNGASTIIRARTGDGAALSGSLDAQTRDEAVGHLRSRSLFVTSVETGETTRGMLSQMRLYAARGARPARRILSLLRDVGRRWRVAAARAGDRAGRMPRPAPLPKRSVR